MKLIKNIALASGKIFKTVNILFDERIELVTTGPVSSENITEEYDYSGCFIIPGAVDMHTHLLSGSISDIKYLNESTQKAIEGGYTTLADMSYISSQPIFRYKDLQYYIDTIEKNSFCDIALWGHTDFSQSPYHIDYINELWSHGLIGFLIMHPSPNPKIDDVSYNDIMDLFDKIYDSDISFAFQGFDRSEMSEKKDANEKFVEQKLSSIRKILRRLQDNPLHFIGVIDKESLDILNIAFRRTDLTYAVPAKALMDIMESFRHSVFEQGSLFSEYIKLLFDSMKNGKVYTISTEAGQAGEMADEIFKAAYSGLNANLLKWTVPWVFSTLWNENKVSIQSCIRMISENPAKRLGLFPAKGCILKGSDADMVIIDPNKPVTTDLLDSNGDKIRLTCSVRATFLRGQLMSPMAKNQKPKGVFVKRTGTTRRKSNSTCWN
jgi:dihydroorotase-like cyclic amidohydrolase